MPSRKGFIGRLIETPAPLPDEEECETLAGNRSGAFAEPVLDAATLAGLPTVLPGVGATSATRTPPLIAAKPSESPEETTAAEEEKAPTTVRLRQSAANALRRAWLAEKHHNVLLSYPEFASDVVRAGLEALERERTR